VTHRINTSGAHLLPVLGCGFPALPLHAKHHLQLAHLCHTCATLLSTAGSVNAQCSAMPCQVLHIFSCCNLELVQANSQPLLQSLACCSTDRHTACTQVKDHEGCCASMSEEQKACLVPRQCKMAKNGVSLLQRTSPGPEGLTCIAQTP